MSIKQLNHIETKNTTRTKEIIVVAENLRTPENVGMLFRISEAFGVKKIILVGNSPGLNNNKVLRTARKTEKNLEIITVENSQNSIEHLVKNGYFLLGLELTNTSTNLKEFNFLTYQKIAVFVGAERFGIKKETLQQLNAIVHINMFGKNSSINVVNALAICLYKICS